MNTPLPDPAMQRALRNLPSVDHLLQQPMIRSLLDEFARPELLAAVREVLEARRRALLAGRDGGDDRQLALAVREALHARRQSSLRRVINATGVVLHTGLGRAPLADAAVEAINSVAAGYSNLEFDLATGQRGDRHDHLRDLLRELTGAEDGLVVNNNAAATLLALRTLADGREAIVSRGQLVEIGGSYRMPDVMAAAGCRLVEVGTTNRTRIADYAAGLTERTAVLLRVHTSNYRIQGFVEETPLVELAALAKERRDPPLWVVDDLGSGLLDTFREHLPEATAARLAAWDEPTVRGSLSAGADLVLFSGDKLLGGPQAGILVGRRDLIARCQRSPLMRACRPDKLSLAALEATLRLYRDPTALLRHLPTMRMLTAAPEELAQAAQRLADRVEQSLPQLHPEARPDHSFAGGGALPTLQLPTWTVRLRHTAVPAQRLADELRRAALPVAARIHDGALVLDCRTLFPADEDALPALLSSALEEALAAQGGSGATVRIHETRPPREAERRV